MKAIYQPKGAAQEYGQWACNLYNGCSNKCDYCYNRHCPQSITLGGDKPTLKKSLVDTKTAFNIFCKEFDEHKDEIIRDGGLFFSFVSDPMLTETFSLSELCASYAMFCGCKVWMLTKCQYDIDWARHHKELLRPGFTLTGMDSMEHGYFSTETRIYCMHRLHELGCKTWASIEPVIDFNCALNAIARSADCCDFYKIGLASKIGVKHNKNEVLAFAKEVSKLVSVPIYWKNSVTKLVGEEDSALLPNQVGADYQF